MSRTDDTALGTWLWIVYASDKKDHLRDFANEILAHVYLYFQFLELFSSILDHIEKLFLPLNLLVRPILQGSK